MARGRGLTADQILDCAQALVQSRGYNGFSYRDLAAALDVRAASLHYHFATKGALAEALVVRYRAQIAAALDDIAARNSASQSRIRGFAELFRRTLRDDDGLCLCGMLGAERASLPAPVVRQVAGFFRDCESWLAEVLRGGREAGEIRRSGSWTEQARALMALLEGAMIVARAEANASAFDGAVASFLGLLEEPAA